MTKCTEIPSQKVSDCPTFCKSDQIYAQIKREIPGQKFMVDLKLGVMKSGNSRTMSGVIGVKCQGLTCGHTNTVCIIKAGSVTLNMT